MAIPLFVGCFASCVFWKLLIGDVLLPLPFLPFNKGGGKSKVALEFLFLKLVEMNPKV
jgi:hypothetical protein